MRLFNSSRGLASLAALALLSAAPFAQTVNDKPEVKTEVLDRVTQLLSNRAFVPGLDFAKWKEFVDAEKGPLDEAKNDEEFTRAINEALSKFGASHIYLASPRSANGRVSNSMVGIGITQQPTDEGTLILRTVKDAPADKAGLVPGDTIVKVDGQPAQGARGIAGEEGTTVLLTVKKADGTIKDVTLTRSKFSTKRPEELVEVDKDTARLAVYTFDLSYDRQNVEDLMGQASKYKNLILDLRDNGGGAVVNMQHLLGFFIPEGKSVGTSVTRRMAKDYVTATKGEMKDVAKIASWSRATEPWKSDDQVQFGPSKAPNAPMYKGRVSVLINRFSGSASEITAAALHEILGAEVVGTKSAGAVLVSVIVPAAKGFTLQYPISDYVTVKGLRIEGNGVTPTAEVEDAKIRLPNAKDPVVERALAQLSTARRTR